MAGKDWIEIEDRVLYADVAARAHFAAREGSIDEDLWEQEAESLLVDLLADLRHWADAKGFDFNKSLDTSYMHYSEEKVEERRMAKENRKRGAK